jgi:DNA-binding transcriptional MerR regulator
MQIGAVAKKTGLSIDAIRFYERNSLLPRAHRGRQAAFANMRRATCRGRL